MTTAARTAASRSANRTAAVRFRAMGSDVHLVLVDAPDFLLEHLRQRIDRLEQRWSRFQPTSEVCTLNDNAGRSVAVSADTRLLVRRALEGWRLTGGGFDPMVLDAVVRAGYDRSFERLESCTDEPITPSHSRNLLTQTDCTDVVIDDASVTIPVGLQFDPGGIGKGLAADLVAGEALEGGAKGVCVNMGGDLRVLGESPSGRGWTLAIDHPLAVEPVAMVGLWEGAVATSSVLRRAWVRNGLAAHHLIDPASGRPASSDLALVTVIAGSAWQAEVLAKAGLLRGRTRAFDLLDSSSASLVVGHDGAVSASVGFDAFLGGATVPTVINAGGDGGRR